MKQIQPLPFSPRLLGMSDEAPNVRTFRFASPPNFAFIPGQFLMFHFADDPKTWRAYSLCSSPARGSEFFEVTVGMVGPFSDRLGALAPGAEHELLARGPFGKWTYDGSAPHAVLIAGGTGVTPFRAMCTLKIDGGKTGKITVCCSAKSPDLLVYRREYALWEKAGITVIPRVTAATWDGLTGRWTADEIISRGGGDDASIYYLCGPNKMVRELREGLESLGIEASRVRAEQWGDYADLI